MCTAATYYAKDHYFGRNLDLEFSYHEEITIVPRSYPFIFRKCEDINHHYAMIGTAFVVEGYPLFYDAVNEKGLGIAGLNFPGNAAYKAEVHMRTMWHHLNSYHGSSAAVPMSMRQGHLFPG